jgi:murein DD-endopeptidase MepM/ murein hydrolase activator NlpD
VNELLKASLSMAGSTASAPLPGLTVPGVGGEGGSTRLAGQALTGAASGSAPGRIGGAATNWKRDPDAEQSGYDIVKPGGVGAPVIAPVDLEVTGKGFQGAGSGETGRGYGNWLSGKFTGEDGRPYELLLGHLNDYSVEPGTRIPAGSVLGTQGVTGRAFGAHVTTHVNALSGGDPWKELDRLTKKWTAPL